MVEKSETFQRQKILLHETYQYLKRDSKYIFNAIGLWFAIFKLNFEIGDPFRSTYYFFRQIDDVLDGDRQVAQEPITYANMVINALTKDEFDDKKYPILKAAKTSVDYLEKVKKSDDKPKELMVQLIEAMMTDNLRMRTGLVLPQEKLYEEYSKQFYPMHNLQLICVGSNVRFNNKFDKFPLLQARIQSLSDLEKDWNKNLKNIPLEVWEKSRIDPHGLNYEEIIQLSIVRYWMFKEAAKCKKDLAETKRLLMVEFQGKNEKYAKFIYGGLIFGLENSLKKILRETKGN